MAATERRSKRLATQRTQYTDFYDEDWDLATAADMADAVNYDVLEYVNSTKFAPADVDRLMPRDLDMAYILKTGLRRPILLEEKPDGMVVPDASFTVNDVCHLVGADRIVDVMDVRTQDALTMTMKEWADYYNDQQKEELFNVISLEFSKSRLDSFVQSPELVRDIDWVDLVWPAEQKSQQTEATNATASMCYPKVQKYCLMSVAGCFTDFHVDFGGSSVWYHVLRGSKQGDTFMIPTGWIHGVYTPTDSLIFGGNFLHGFNIDGQLRIAALERRLQVPLMYRFPLFEELMWYAASIYSRALQVSTHHIRIFERALSEWEKTGLQELLAQLRVWLMSPAHREFIPSNFTVKACQQLLQDLNSMLNPSVEATALGNVTNDDDVRKYSRLQYVIDQIIDRFGPCDPGTLLRHAASEWMSLPKASQLAFRAMFQNPSWYKCAVQGSTSDITKNELLQTSDRLSKYSGSKWKSSITHLRKAQALSSLKWDNDSAEERDKRISAARAILDGPLFVVQQPKPDISSKSKVFDSNSMNFLSSLPGLNNFKANDVKRTSPAASTSQTSAPSLEQIRSLRHSRVVTKARGPVGDDVDLSILDRPNRRGRKRSKAKPKDHISSAVQHFMGAAATTPMPQSPYHHTLKTYQNPVESPALVHPVEKQFMVLNTKNEQRGSGYMATATSDIATNPDPLAAIWNSSRFR